MNHIIKDLPPSLKLIQDKLRQLKSENKFEIQNGDEGYATAPSNIALLKYWGKAQNRSQIPTNSNLSYTLGGFRSFTKITTQGRFLPDSCNKIPPIKNRLFLNNDKNQKILPEKMDILIQSIFYNFADEISLKIESHNNFPTACGIASSASGYAALIGAIADLLQLKNHLTKEELHTWLTEWARLGSGSATRSAIECAGDSFVKWELESAHDESFTKTSLMPHHPKWKQLEHCVFVLNSNEKVISSSEGHKSANTSALNAIRVAGIPKRMVLISKALKEFDFELLQQLSEEDALSMHAVMQTGTPAACYLDHDVSKAIALFIKLRDESELKAFWTLDAGPNIHLIFTQESKQMIQNFHVKLQELFNKKINVFMNSYRSGLLIGKENFDNLSSIEILKNSIN
ncbi:diphosphomevalonate decarboxylase [Fluviispira multicolorata]|uniref:diphosphomevalonate decarboxylase n=1 Tax=Fluviispira multicolorata TaxID=2654512 RepID=A0A833JDK4_9BACT|nr:diphosphomevalonate decarboxylase [Fluviispira multicolorata]KAB8031814.1 diphosphomevalonate decarboxylase [Fluviispira multicolorata]